MRFPCETSGKLVLFAGLLAAGAFSTLGCHAQPPAGQTATAGKAAGQAAGQALGKPLTPEQARRVELLIRSRAKLPPDYLVMIGPRMHSEIPGFDEIEVSFSQGPSAPHALPFLLSTDAKTLAQFNKYDLSADPRTLVSSEGRPSRGGPASAPVQIVVFDDLECPFCTRMHAQLFPALTERYGNQVRIVYRDFPLSIHPWAVRAAVDTNCLAAQNSVAYWASVDYIHAHASDFGGPEHSLDKANQQLDQVALDEGKKDALKQPELEACVKKQDDTQIKASLKLGEGLGLEGTPALFINGEKLEGAYPLPDVFRRIDGALVAAGQTPPPPYVAPAAPATPVVSGGAGNGAPGGLGHLPPAGK